MESISPAIPNSAPPLAQTFIDNKPTANQRLIVERTHLGNLHNALDLVVTELLQLSNQAQPGDLSVCVHYKRWLDITKRMRAAVYEELDATAILLMPKPKGETYGGFDI